MNTNDHEYSSLSLLADYLLNINIIINQFYSDSNLENFFCQLIRMMTTTSRVESSSWEERRTT